VDFKNKSPIEEKVGFAFYRQMEFEEDFEK